MPTDPRHFTVVDPRTFDGNPFEVADRAVAQVIGLLEIIQGAIDDAELMARNAELERQCQRKEDLDAVGWPDSAEGKRWAGVRSVTEQTTSAVQILKRAASFDPRNPPKS